MEERSSRGCGRGCQLEYLQENWLLWMYVEAKFICLSARAIFFRCNCPERRGGSVQYEGLVLLVCPRHKRIAQVDSFGMKKS